MEQNNILVSIVMGGVALITSVISIFTGKGKKADKALPKGEAESEAEAKTEELEIQQRTISLITEAEGMFKDMNTFMKNAGNGSAGGLKKNYVLMGLKTFCLEHGYTWDDEKMNEIIENLIVFTKSVNAIK